jgi:hypothetical protein
MHPQFSNGQPMGDRLPDGEKRPIAHPRAQARSAAARKTQGRRLAPILGYGLLLGTAVTAMAIAAHSMISGHSARAPGIAMATADGDLRAAKITRDLGGKMCAQDTFDNQTGRMTRSSQPCDATAYDGNGAPIPLGTIHRLDAINKSFPGR